MSMVSGYEGRDGNVISCFLLGVVYCLAFAWRVSWYIFRITWS